MDKLLKRRDVGGLIIALSHRDPAVRASAAVRLGELADPAAIDALVTAGSDPEPLVRRQAVVALSRWNDPRCVEPLIAALDDPGVDWEATRHAVTALGRLRRRRAVPVLRRLLLAENLAPPQVVWSACDSLRRIHDQGIIQFLMPYLADPRQRGAILDLMIHIAGDEAVLQLLTGPDLPDPSEQWLETCPPVPGLAARQIDPLIDLLAESDAARAAQVTDLISIACRAPSGARETLRRRFPELMSLGLSTDTLYRLASLTNPSSDDHVAIIEALGRGAHEWNAGLVTLLTSALGEPAEQLSGAAARVLREAIPAISARGMDDAAAQAALRGLIHAARSQAAAVVKLCVAAECPLTLRALAGIVTSGAQQRLAVRHHLDQIRDAQARDALRVEAMRDPEIEELADRIVASRRYVEGDRDVRRLVKKGEAAVEPLLRRMSGESTWLVARILGRVRAQSAVEPLGEALLAASLPDRQPRSTYSYELIQALAKLDSPRARHYLRQVFEHGNAEDRIDAAVTLGKLGDVSVFQYLFFSVPESYVGPRRRIEEVVSFLLEHHIAELSIGDLEAVMNREDQEVFVPYPELQMGGEYQRWSPWEFQRLASEELRRRRT